VRWTVVATAGLRTSALYQVEYDHDERQDQQDMYEATHGVRAHEPKQPEDDQDDSDSPQHVVFPYEFFGTSADPDTTSRDRCRQGCVFNMMIFRPGITVCAVPYLARRPLVGREGAGVPGAQYS
jgi:hypothetical protein